MRVTVRRTLVAAGLTAAAVAATSTAVPAQAAGTVVLTAAYDASGSTFIKSTKSTVALPTTTLTAGLDADGGFTGSLPLKPSATTFKILGLLPVSATVTFSQVGQVTGQLGGNPLPTVTATAVYSISLSNVKVAGLPVSVGSSCRTVSPVSITVATPAGKSFDITSGGVVSGTYTIGKFGNCGFTTGLLNLLIPGSGNTVSFTLSNGRILG